MAKFNIASSLTDHVPPGSLASLILRRTTVMGMRFSIELSDRDLKFFRKALKKSRDAVRHAEESEIIEAIGDMVTGLPAKARTGRE